MSAAEHAEALAWLADEPVDALCDMGGELIAAVAVAGRCCRGDDHRPAPAAGRGRALPGPGLERHRPRGPDPNRHHVGLETWPSFTAITGLALYGRSVLVVGFGLVGRGVALRARDPWANVAVADLDPVRLLEARHRGHSNRELDVDRLERHPRTSVRRHLQRYEVGRKRIFPLNRGSLVNLAVGLGIASPQLFDPLAAVMLLGLRFVLTGGARTLPPGVQPCPSPLEARIARDVVDG